MIGRTCHVKQGKITILKHFNTMTSTSARVNHIRQSHELILTPLIDYISLNLNLDLLITSRTDREPELPHYFHQLTFPQPLQIPWG